MQPGYRRRILIEPDPGCVTAEVEDDYHRMVVTLRHADGNVTDEIDGVREARLARGAAALLQWRLKDDRFLGPADLAGKRLSEMEPGARPDHTRDGTHPALGRDAGTGPRDGHARRGMSAMAWSMDSCFHFQPERAKDSTRFPGADIDFSTPGREPMADRFAAFTNCPADVA